MRVAITVVTVIAGVGAAQLPLVKRVAVEANLPNAGPATLG